MGQVKLYKFTTSFGYNFKAESIEGAKEIAAKYFNTRWIPKQMSLRNWNINTFHLLHGNKELCTFSRRNQIWSKTNEFQLTIYDVIDSKYHIVVEKENFIVIDTEKNKRFVYSKKAGNTLDVLLVIYKVALEDITYNGGKIND